MSRRYRRSIPRPWIPMQRASLIPKSDAELEEMAAAARADGMPVDAETIRQLVDGEGRECWRNDRYIVIVSRDSGGHVTTLSIRRDDRKPLRDWRHFQWIKNDIAGEEVEAVELFPAESRLVDTANQYWLWCLPPGEQAPFGFQERLVSGSAEAGPYGSVQRDL